MQWLSNLSFNDYFFGFAFLYPLFMAWLWIAGGIWFYLKREYKQNEIPQPSEHACSILIPCFNEEEQVREIYGPVHSRLLKQALDLINSADEAREKSQPPA